MNGTVQDKGFMPRHLLRLNCPETDSALFMGQEVKLKLGMVVPLSLQSSEKEIKLKLGIAVVALSGTQAVV